MMVCDFKLLCKNMECRKKDESHQKGLQTWICRINSGKY